MLLPEILQELVKNSLGIEAVYITKEFPVLTKRCQQSNHKRSFCVDYLMHDSDKVYFVELKTDLKSLVREQDERYQKIVKNHTFAELYKDYMTVISVGRNKGKYAQQRTALEKALGTSWQDKKEIGMIYILPREGNANVLGSVVNLEKAYANKSDYSENAQTFLEICSAILPKRN